MAENSTAVTRYARHNYCFISCVVVLLERHLSLIIFIAILVTIVFWGLLASSSVFSTKFSGAFVCFYSKIKRWTSSRKHGQIYPFTHWTLYGLFSRWLEPTLHHLSGSCCLSWSSFWLCISDWLIWPMQRNTFIVRPLHSILLSPTLPLTTVLHHNSVRIPQPSKRARSSRSLHCRYCRCGLHSLFTCQDNHVDSDESR